MYQDLITNDKSDRQTDLFVQVEMNFWLIFGISGLGMILKLVIDKGKIS